MEPHDDIDRKMTEVLENAKAATAQQLAILERQTIAFESIAKSIKKLIDNIIPNDEA